MPRFDGTGPRGLGPMSGRGEGYCVVQLPEADQPPRGFAGLGGWPIGDAEPVTPWAPSPPRRPWWPATRRPGLRRGRRWQRWR